MINFIVDAQMQIELSSAVNALLEKRFFYNCISWSLMIERLIKVLERKFLFADDLRHRYPRDLVTSISP